MKDIKSIERRLPVIALDGQIVFPLVDAAVRVGRESAETLMKAARDRDDLALAVTRKSQDNGKKPAHIGTLVKVESVRNVSTGSELTLKGLAKIRVENFFELDGLWADFDFQDDQLDMDSDTDKALQQTILSTSKSILGMIQNSEGIWKVIEALDSTEELINFSMQHIPIPSSEKQEFLEITSRKAQGLKLLDILTHQKESLKLQIEMAGKVSDEAGKNHRETILREQLRMIREELGESKGGKSKDFRERIEKAGMPEDVKTAAYEELEKLEGQGPNSPDSAIIRNYLDLLLALPWTDPEVQEIDLEKARKILDEDHFGLDKVKDLIVQHLAVLKLKKDKKGAVLLLVGPPGVGKTSLGKSIARAMDREFIRASLGGVRDDAEIRGHRRTYIGALPGRILQSMKRAGKKNPVFLLDEIDKLNRGWGGDPGSALLEVLDPEQNNTFQDHYLDLPYDLSHVFFIATANSLENIPAPLLDRMEVIHLSGYTENEKFRIAKDFLVPKQLELHGLSNDQLAISDEVLEELASSYTREAGVRELQRKIATLCRVYSEKVVKAAPGTLPIHVVKDELDTVLGHEKVRHERTEEVMPPGVVTGLAWTPMGGDILFLEATHMPGSGQLTLTGQLGDVMKESARIALSLVRSQLPFLTKDFLFKETDIHVHVPSGAIPKDGPSAGVAMFTTLTSLVLGRQVDSKLAMTGEITLRGAVMPVGGIKEKVIAAHRAGVRRLILPQRNEQDLRDVPEEVRKDLEVHFVERVGQVLEFVFGLKSVDYGLHIQELPLPSAPTLS